MSTKKIDWSKCEDVESVPGRVSGAWVIKGMHVQADAIVEMPGPDAWPKKSPAPSIPLDIVKRVLRFAKMTPPSKA